jgi:hypothetical protein
MKKIISVWKVNKKGRLKMKWKRKKVEPVSLFTEEEK